MSLITHNIAFFADIRWHIASTNILVSRPGTIKISSTVIFVRRFDFVE